MLGISSQGQGTGGRAHSPAPAGTGAPLRAAAVRGRVKATGRQEHPTFHPETRRPVPILLRQIGLHLKENVLPLFYEALGLSDGLLLVGAHVGSASGEETQALAPGQAPLHEQHMLDEAPSAVLCPVLGSPVQER